MSAYQYIIIGGGISGLYAAYLLEQRGITDYLLLEAKSSLGGRLHSAFTTDSSGINAAFDLGATWFWEDQQPELAQLIKDLNLSSFEQYTQGEMLLERSSTQPALHTRDFNGESSKRIDGGMKAFVDQLYARLTADRILLSHQVLQLSHEDHCIKVQVASQAGQVKVFQTSQVLMAIPPRLAISSIQFTPALPEHFQSTLGHSGKTRPLGWHRMPSISRSTKLHFGVTYIYLEMHTAASGLWLKFMMLQQSKARQPYSVLLG